MDKIIKLFEYGVYSWDEAAYRLTIEFRLTDDKIVQLLGERNGNRDSETV